MKKALFVVSGGVPAPTGDGMRVGTWVWIHSLKAIGFEPICVPCMISGAFESSLAEDMLRLRFDGVTGVTDLVRPHLCTWPRLALLARAIAPVCYHKIMAPKQEETITRQIIANFGPDLILAFHWGAVRLVGGVSSGIPTVAVLVDLPGDNAAVRWRGLSEFSGRAKIKEFLSILGQRSDEKLLLKELRAYSAIVEHANNHAERLRQLGFQNVWYIPHCMPEPARRDLVGVEPRSSDLVNILILGSVKGATSRQGFEFLLHRLLPELRLAKSRIRRKYKIRIVGHGVMLPTLKQALLSQPEIEWGGFAPDENSVASEYSNANIILVPIPVRVGFRTRIAEAFGYGKCVVAHSANCAGMPEVKDGVNALCAERPSELADRLISAINDPLLRERLGASARATFINSYSPNAMRKHLVDLVSTLYGERGAFGPSAADVTNDLGQTC